MGSLGNPETFDGGMQLGKEGIQFAGSLPGP